MTSVAWSVWLWLTFRLRNPLVSVLGSALFLKCSFYDIVSVFNHWLCRQSCGTVLEKKKEEKKKVGVVYCSGSPVELICKSSTCHFLCTSTAVLWKWIAGNECCHATLVIQHFNTKEKMQTGQVSKLCDKVFLSLLQQFLLLLSASVQLNRLVPLVVDQRWP